MRIDEPWVDKIIKDKIINCFKLKKFESKKAERKFNAKKNKLQEKYSNNHLIFSYLV